MDRAKKKPIGGLTHRTVLAEKAQQSHACLALAASIQEAVNDGIDHGVSDDMLSAGVARIMELEEQAAHETAAVRRDCM